MLKLRLLVMTVRCGLAQVRARVGHKCDECHAAPARTTIGWWALCPWCYGNAVGD